MDIRQNVQLAPYTTFGIGGPAGYFIVVHSAEEIIEAVNWAQNPSSTPDVKGRNTSGVSSLPFFLLGTGANILVGDKGYRGVVIKNEANKFQISNFKYPISNDSSLRVPLSGAKQSQARVIPGSDQESIKIDSRLRGNDKEKVFLTVESGATIEELIHFTSEKGLSGLEHFAGIPSSVGGALWQNLHFLFPDRSKTVFIGDMVDSAVILPSLRATDGSAAISEIASSQAPRNDELKTIIVDQSYFQFSYDYSILHDTHDIVLSATFALTPEDPKIIQDRIIANLKWRGEKHPTNAVKTSAGSIFKKIEGYGAGRLIEQVGLKGKIIGGAKISDQHANFIVNDNNASAKDVRDLIELVKTTVKKQLGLEMQTEISMVGEF